jgi:hypothetical protein
VLVGSAPSSPEAAREFVPNFRDYYQATHARSHARTHARLHARTHAHACARTHAHARMRTHAYARTHTHARTRTHTHARTRTHKHAQAHANANAFAFANVWHVYSSPLGEHVGTQWPHGHTRRDTRTRVEMFWGLVYVFQNLFETIRIFATASV